jgi:membrane-associated protease RseP (regulator of RpoE activity)
MAGCRLPAERVRLVLDHLAAGLNPNRAARAAGVSVGSACRLHHKMGGVYRPPGVTYSARYLDREERYEIARLRELGLTDKGLRLFDVIAPVHLANEDRLLSALSRDERRTLADLLRRLLAGFESSTTDVAAGLGLTLEPAHLARTRRQAVGLSDTPGLLVTDVVAGSAAAEAGIERGDLITALDGTAVTSSVGLAGLLADLAGRRTVTLNVLRGNDAMTVGLRLPRAR